MRWLVVIDRTLLMPAALEAVLAKACAHAAPSTDPVPLSDGETSIEVEGPEDLPNRLRSNRAIKGVYPSSDYTLY